MQLSSKKLKQQALKGLQSIVIQETLNMETEIKQITFGTCKVCNEKEAVYSRGICKDCQEKKNKVMRELESQGIESGTESFINKLKEEILKIK